MAVRIIKKSWWVDFRVDHIRYRKRSPENTRTGALAYEANLRQKLARGEAILRRAGTNDQTFAEFSAKWFEEYVVPNNKPSEQKTKKYLLSASLLPFFGRMRIQEIGPRDIERYKATLVEKGISRKTMNNRLSGLRMCLKAAYEWLELKGQPPKILWLKSPPPQTDYLTPDECDLLIRHSDGIIHEMIVTAIRTGMRQGELKGLQWESIDWLNRGVSVRHSYYDLTKTLGTTKGNRERHIPLDIDVLEVLSARRRETGFVFVNEFGMPFDQYRLASGLHRVCERAGLRWIGWHTLRHSFASHLAMNGTPLHVVQALLGHTNIATTMRYAHVAPSALRLAIELANPRTAPAPSLGQPAGNRWQELQRNSRLRNGTVSEEPAVAPQNWPEAPPLAA